MRLACCLIAVISSVMNHGCCSRNSDSVDEVAQKEESTVTRPRVALGDVDDAHGYIAARFDAVSEAFLLLIRARQALGTLEFDPILREMSKLMCQGVDSELMKKMESSSIDQMYPVDVIDDCIQMYCGGCQRRDGELKPGRIFAKMPTVQPKRPSREMRFPRHPAVYGPND